MTKLGRVGRSVDAQQRSALQLATFSYAFCDSNCKVGFVSISVTRLVLWHLCATKYLLLRALPRDQIVRVAEKVDEPDSVARVTEMWHYSCKPPVAAVDRIGALGMFLELYSADLTGSLLGWR